MKRAAKSIYEWCSELSKKKVKTRFDMELLDLLRKLTGEYL